MAGFTSRRGFWHVWRVTPLKYITSLESPVDYIRDPLLIEEQSLQMREALEGAGMYVSSMAQDFVARPMLRFKVRAVAPSRRQGARTRHQQLVVMPPLVRFFDLHDEPLVEAADYGRMTSMWIQPEVFEREGVIFQGSTLPTDTLIPIPVSTPDVQEMGNLLVALDDFLETGRFLRS